MLAVRTATPLNIIIQYIHPLILLSPSRRALSTPKGLQRRSPQMEGLVNFGGLRTNHDLVELVVAIVSFRRPKPVPQHGALSTGEFLLVLEVEVGLGEGLVLWSLFEGV